MKQVTLFRLALVLALTCSLGLSAPPPSGSVRDLAAKALTGCGALVLATSLIFGVGGMVKHGWGPVRPKGGVDARAANWDLKASAVTGLTAAALFTGGAALWGDYFLGGKQPTILLVTGVPLFLEATIDVASFQRFEGAVYEGYGYEHGRRDIAFELEEHSWVSREIVIKLTMVGHPEETFSYRIRVEGGKDTDVSSPTLVLSTPKA